MHDQNTTTPDDLAFLRQETLRPVLIGVMVVLYLWYIILFQPVNSIGASAWGLVMLGGGLVLAFFYRRRNLTVASIALISGIAAAIIYSMWQLNSAVAPYLLAIVVSLTGLLFGMRAVIWVTVLCGVLVIFTGWVRWGYTPVSTEVLSPLFVIGSVGLLSTLTVRNLYLTLYWAWDRAMAAQQNEEKLLDRQGELARTLKALDVAYTQLERLNYDLDRARQAADDARLDKQRFVTNISHELRTPLNVIMAFSEMMYLSPGSYGNKPLPAAYRGDVREIYRSSKHLIKLTDDVLNLAKIEAREMKIHPQQVDLHHMVAEAIKIIRPLVRDKDVKLQADLPDDLPPVVVDEDRIGQVLLNLLNNARRYTEQGTILVTAVAENGKMHVTVADTGIGILPEERHKVFKEFRQLDPSLRTYQGGSGLGLAISKRFVEMHGGKIWVESEGIPGKGAQFHFTLPVSQTELPQVIEAKASSLAVRTPTGRGRTLLLLDKNPELVHLLEQGLEDYRIVPVDEVSQVPGLIEANGAKAIVTNLVCTEEAWQNIEDLRKIPQLDSIPVIACPLVSPQHLGQAFGAVDYLVKPVTREAIESLLDQLGEQIQRILVVDDDPRMANLLSRFLQTSARQFKVERAINGYEGLQAMKAHPPDLVLMDLTMPKMDGRVMLGQIKADSTLCNIPVAIVTAHTGTPAEERQLGGKSLFVSSKTGFSNDEVLAYLRGMLTVTVVPLRRRGHTIQHS